jgi:AcrR family transcriptional regulator
MPMASTDPVSRPPEPLFQRLPGGPGGLDRDEVARHQKARLEGAVVDAVARHGFASTTIRELVTLAGVSKSTFYEHFEGKEDCFLSTFDTIMAQVTQEVGEAYAQPGEPRERMLRALDRFTAMVDERPEAISFVTVDSLTLGAAAVARREKSWQGFEAIARPHVSPPEPDAEVSDLTIRAVVAGTTGVVYRCLRSGQSKELRRLVEPLIDWAFSYSLPQGEKVRQAVAAAERPAAPPPTEEPAGDAPGWEEPPASPRSRSSLSQRERIIRAAVRVVVERGYGALSIPAISAAAGTSNQTFYENFNSKRDAFLAGYESVSAEAIARTSAALDRAENGPEAVGFALRALSEYIAGNELYARLAFFELPTAGPPALDRADETIDLLVSFLERGGEDAGGPPRVVLEATAAGIWFVIQREIAHGRRQALPARAGELARIALAPLARG